MIGPEDVAAGVLTRWAAAGGDAAAPGGLWYGRVAEAAAAPYARLTVSGQELSRLSNGKYHRAFSVRIEIWGDAGPTAGKAARAAAEAAMLAGLAVAGAVKVVDVKEQPTELSVEESPRGANDVCLTALEWRVLIHGS